MEESMKTAPTLIVALMAAMATAARAGTPGVNLSWDDCSTSPASANQDYACDGKLGSRVSLQGTFRNAYDVGNLYGLESTLMIVWPESVPDFWAVGPGGCDLNAFGLAHTSATPPCGTPSIFDSTLYGGYSVDYPTPNRLLLRIDTSPNPYPNWPSLTAAELYPAFKVSFDVDAGIAHACLGCDVPACIVLQSVEVFGLYPTQDYLIVDPDTRNWCTWQGGAVAGAGCPGSTPVQNRTWGAVKALYR
jgi:hypothetical protein